MTTPVRQRLTDARRRVESLRHSPVPRAGTASRTEAGDTREVAFTVNGTPVCLRVPPRRTLADVLRLDLGLTGTHLGCEHGVCGMCTVVVDGDAARACLLFAVQLDGAEVLTVEGLGGPDSLHPLQASFAHHHGLQCGFCTPGFLMSAYDLLSKRPDVPTGDLPAELSGVLCRCTGYRNIVAAVDAVARAYPDGIPGPGNTRPQVLKGRTGALATPRPAAAGGGSQAALEVAIPSGPPTLTVEVASELTATPAQVWAVLDDPITLVRCLPGAELTAEVGDGRYRGRARVALGPVRLAFEGLAHITERDAEAHRLRILAAGRDASGQTQADIRIVAEAVGETTRVSATAEVWMAGRIAQFGRALAGDVSRRMFEQFARSVEQAATTGTAPDATSTSPGALGMVLRSVWDRLVQALRRRR